MESLRIGMPTKLMTRYRAKLEISDAILLAAHKAYIQSQMPGCIAPPESPVLHEATLITMSTERTAVHFEIVSARLGDIPYQLVGRITRLLVRITSAEPDNYLIRVPKHEREIGLFFGVNCGTPAEPTYTVTDDCMVAYLEYEAWHYLAHNHCW